MSPPAGSFLSDAFKLPFSARIAHTHTHTLLFFFSPPVQHFSELLDDLSHDALLGQLLSDPFLSGGRAGAEAMEGEDGGGGLSPSSPLPPHITAEHSYSLCGDSRPQSPLSHLTGEQGSDAGERGAPVGKGFCSPCSYHSSQNYSLV